MVIKRIYLIAMIAAVVATFTVPPSAGAETILTDAQIERIKTNCTESKNSLRRLDTADKLLRLNFGQHYESISTRLMKPLNNRITSQGMDASDMKRTEESYNRQLNEFRSKYQDYSMTLTDIYNNKSCSEDPVEYYNAIVELRTKRQVVYESTQSLNKLIQQYHSQFEIFKKNFDKQVTK